MYVLVVENDPKLAAALERRLLNGGLAVDVAHTAFEAQAMVRAVSYSVIILDRELPDRDGIEFCKSLRQAGFRSGVIMLTACGATEDKILGLNAGADDYLIKPLDLDELLARLRALSVVVR